MGENTDAARAPFRAVRPGSLRQRILDYIAEEGGELRSDSGQGLRRQVADALGERPTPVGQALIALEKSGLLEREMDLTRHRCQAIRLTGPWSAPHPVSPRHRENDPTPERALRRPVAATARQRAELEAAERELYDLIRRAAEASRRVGELRWVVLRGNDHERGIAEPGDRAVSAAGRRRTGDTR